MRKYIFILCTLNCWFTFLNAQVSDDFSDGDFTNNPTWIGDQDEFLVNGNFELQSNGSDAGEYYLSTPNTLLGETEWRFRFDLNGSGPSSNNFFRAYLISDQADLTGALNGYYIRIGEAGSTDGIDLFRQDGTDIEKIIDGNPSTVASNVDVVVRVIRDDEGNWQIFADLSGSGEFELQGSVTDDNYTVTAHMGFVLNYTSSRSADFIIDDVFLGNIVGDETPPMVSSIEVAASDQLIITFDEAVDPTSAENVSNYLVNEGIGNPDFAVVNTEDPTQVLLFLSSALENGTEYILSVGQIQDLFGNTLEDADVPFTFLIAELASPGDVIINELMPDPTPSQGLPEAEYIELYNRSNKILNLEAWLLVNSDNSSPLPSVFLRPDSFLIITSASNVALFEFFGPTVSPSSFTALANAGDDIAIRSAEGLLIDSISYTRDWYNDPDRIENGHALERVNPNEVLCPDITNWRASLSDTGGTPGDVNSVLSTTPESIPPALDDITINSNTELLVCFNEPMDASSLSNPTNYTLGSLGNPSGVLIQDPDALCVLLTFSDPIETGVEYILAINNVSDCSGNTPASALTQNIVIGRVAEPLQVIINEIFPDFTPSQGLPEGEFVELLNRSEFVLDLSNWTLSNNSRTITWGQASLQPGEYLIICDDEDQAQFESFGNVISVPSFLSMRNTNDSLSLQNAEGILIDSVYYNERWYGDDIKANGGFTLERINPDEFSCAAISNWTASNNAIGGTPGAENSVFSQIPDELAPQFESLRILSPNQLELCFNESMDPASLELTGNYSLSEIGNPESVLASSPDFLCVILTFADSLQEGTVYILTVNNVSDCSGNGLEQTISEEIVIGKPAEPGDILINEIFADPTPSQGLPQAEFIEIYNRTNLVLDISGWSLRTSSRQTFWGQNELQGGEYLIICDEDDVDDFSPFGRVLGVSSFPSLSNSGDTLELRNSDGVSIDLVVYADTWYQDEEKSDGGYTLERINPDEFNCPSISNWIASNATIGGTPGTENSVFSTAPDTSPPLLLAYTIISENELELCFNESMDDNTLVQLDSYVLTGNINPIESSPVRPELFCVRIGFADPFVIGSEFSLNLSGIADCSGNAIVDTSVQIVLGRSALAGEIIINELMVDPSPVQTLPEADFVEIFNITDDILDITNWSISNKRSVVSWGQAVIEANSYIIICDLEDAPEFESFGQVIGVDGFPTLRNDADSVIIINREGLTIDSVFYTSDWYQDEEKDNGGFSLERINPQAQDCPPIANWRASIATNGSTLLGGTPGAVNSVFSLAPDETAPLFVGFSLLADTVIQICFNEPMDANLLTDVSNYQLSSIGSPISASPLSSDLLCVNLTFGTPLDTGVTYQLTIAQLADCNGNNITEEILVSISLGKAASPFEIIINEFLPDPTPTRGLPEERYVELYNRSDIVVDISNWSISNRRSTSTWGEATLAPGEYVIICDDDAIEEFSTFGNILTVSSMPSLRSAADTLQLFNSEGLQIDRVFYDESWFGSRGDGGYSLERIDQDYVECNQQENWRASQAELGGTPGGLNSVDGSYLDNKAPQIETFEIINATEFRLRFNEEMDSVLLEDVNLYEISPGIGNPLLASDISLDSREVTLFLSQALDSSVVYTLTINGILDCAGNDTTLQLTLGLPQLPVEGDLLINEILFNPLSGGSDYVEIFNSSDKIINLADLTLAEVDLDVDTLTNLRIVSESFFSLLPGELICLTPDVDFQKSIYSPPSSARFFETESFPTYDDSEGAVVILSNSVILERFDYTDDLHFPTLADDDGVSLERISLDRPASAPGNWHSAAATVNFGTPGYENSQFVELMPEDAEVSLEKQLFTPNDDGMDDVLAINYDFDFIGANTRVTVFDSRGRQIKLLQNNTLLGSGPGTIFWDGRDDTNQRADIGMYVILFEVVNQDSGEKRVYKRVAVLAEAL